MIKFENVSFGYADNINDVLALSSVSLEIEEGEFVCIVGHSGCGKTTLLRLMAGLEEPLYGRITVGGKELTGPGDNMAIVFQDYALFPWMSAERNVLFAVEHTHNGLTKAEAKNIANEMLSQVGMLDSKDKHPYQMSGGMRQRVAIARALAMDRDIILMDEPFGALDTKIRGELQNLLERLCDTNGTHKTVVFVTHDIKEAVRMADRIIVMNDGMLKDELLVPVERLRTDPDRVSAGVMRDIRIRLTDIMMDESSESGRGCKCGGPA